MKKILITISIVLSLSLVIAGGVGYYFSNVLLMQNFTENYGKTSDTVENIKQFKALQEELENEKITIPSSYGYDLVGYYFPAKKDTNRTIITVHGYQSSKDSQAKYIKMYHELGFNVVTYDQRNHGESGGTYTTYGLIESEDLKDVVSYVKDRQTNNKEKGLIGIHGVSMGAATTLQYAGNVEDKADFYIADCAYSNFGEEAKYRLAEDYSYIPAFLHKPIVFLGDTVLKIRENYSIFSASPIDTVENIKSPVLFINTKTDDYIPPYMTQDLFDKTVGPKEIYWTDTGKHAKAFDVNPDQYKEVVINFLEKHIK